MPEIALDRATALSEPAPLLVIAGPTASGKSGLALRLAERLGGAVINADSMQIYRDLRVLTARPGPADLARAPHLLYGILDGADACSAARWAALAEAAIEAARRDGRVPILCGGTGLYLRTLLNGIAPVPPIPPDIRAGARGRHRALGGAAFRAELARLDPAGAAVLHENDSQRLIRAYEVVSATGRTLGDWQSADDGGGRLGATVITLAPPRAALYAAIDRRFDAMLAAGALDEVRALRARDLAPDLPVMKALGVPPLIDHLAGFLTLAAAADLAKAASRQYAKRQTTWWRHQIISDYRLEAQLSESYIDEFCQKICKALDLGETAA